MKFNQTETLKILTYNKISPNDQPVIQVGDIIEFSEVNDEIDYWHFAKLLNFNFEYVETRHIDGRSMRITGLLVKHQQPR